MEIGQKITIQCIESDEGCSKCVFSKYFDTFLQYERLNCRIRCDDHEREDKKSVIFIEVKE